MGQRGNRSGWVLTAMVVIAIVIFRSRMVPNIVVPYGPQGSSTNYQFTAVMSAPAKHGLFWMLTRRADQTQYQVEVYNNQQPVRAFSTVRTTTAQTPGHQYACTGSVKINGAAYQATSLRIAASGRQGVLTLAPAKGTSTTTP